VGLLQIGGHLATGLMPHQLIKQFQQQPTYSSIPIGKEIELQIHL
jgi:hypothetical protein